MQSKNTTINHQNLQKEPNKKQCILNKELSHYCKVKNYHTIKKQKVATNHQNLQRALNK
jgi:hypothetical protein